MVKKKAFIKIQKNCREAIILHEESIQRCSCVRLGGTSYRFVCIHSLFPKSQIQVLKGKKRKFSSNYSFFFYQLNKLILGFVIK